MGKHSAKGELELYPGELETVPLFGVIFYPKSGTEKQLSGGTISNFHFACGCCNNAIFEKKKKKEKKKVVQNIAL